MKKISLIILTVLIFAILGSIGFGCGENSPVTPSSTELITDAPGCLSLDIYFIQQETKERYWINDCFEDNGLLIVIMRDNTVQSFLLEEIEYSINNNCK